MNEKTPTKFYSQFATYWIKLTKKDITIHPKRAQPVKSYLHIIYIYIYIIVMYQDKHSAP